MALQITSPFPQFFDIDGSPLDGGYIYIGAENDNPESNQVQVYWDFAQTIPAAQPLRTVNGYIARNGTPASVFVDANSYSCTARNSSRELVVYSPSVAVSSIASVAAATAAAAAAAQSAIDAQNAAAGLPTIAVLEDYLAKMRVPIGSIIALATEVVPYGYYECYGSAVSRIANSLLFQAIGTRWGAGDGVNTFNLPNLCGEFLRGWDHGRGVDTGRAFASAQADALKSHTHTGAVNALTTGTVAGSGMWVGGSSTAATSATGGTETRPRNVAVMYVIKAFDAPLNTVEPNYNKSPVTAITSASGVLNVDLELGNYFTVALTEDITSVTFSNLPGAGFGTTVMLRVTQGLSAYTVAWPASFRWEGAAPSVSTASGAVDVLALTTFDNGTKWDAVLSKGRA